jgi:hypothetical protein
MPYSAGPHVGHAVIVYSDRIGALMQFPHNPSTSLRDNTDFACAGAGASPNQFCARKAAPVWAVQTTAHSARP